MLPQFKDRRTNSFVAVSIDGEVTGLWGWARGAETNATN